MADELPDESPPVQPRARDYLSAAVESRARGRAAIADGGSPGAAKNPFKVPLAPRGATVTAMEHAEDDPPVGLRPTKGPVQPMSKEDLLPQPRISAEQEAILSRLSPPSAAPDEAPEKDLAGAPARSKSNTEPSLSERATASTRRTRAVEMPEPPDRLGRKGFYAPEWDRYYNPGFYPGAKVPHLPIGRRTPDPSAPAWTMIGRPRGEGSTPESQRAYRASLKEGIAMDTRPQREVKRFLEQRGDVGEELDLVGPSDVPPEDEDALARESERRAEFEAAIAGLERSFKEAQPAQRRVPPTGVAAPPATAPSRAAPLRAPSPSSVPPSQGASRERPIRAASGAVQPSPMKAPAAPPKPLSRSARDPHSEEDDEEMAAEDEEEGTLGRAPPPDHKAEGVAKRPLPHDATGASLCPTCGRRIGGHSPVLVCTACGRVGCGSCGRFTMAGQPAASIYQYEYKFSFPLCEPCFQRHYNTQKNIARAKAYLSSGNLTYAYYHAQTAGQLDPQSPYAGEVETLIKQIEARRAQMAKADKQWEEARKKLMKGRTSVLR